MENSTYHYDYDKISKTILAVVNGLNAPISKKILIDICKNFGCEDGKHTEAVLDNLIENNELYQSEKYIYSKTYNPRSFSIKPTAREEALQKFIPCLLREAIEDYNYCPNIDAETFFKWLSSAHPGLVGYNTLKMIDWIYSIVKKEHLSEQFLLEGLYGEDGWFGDFFNNPHCQIWIQTILYDGENRLFIRLFLIPDKKGDYKKARKQYDKVWSHISDYFDIGLAIDTTPMHYII